MEKQRASNPTELLTKSSQFLSELKANLKSYLALREKRSNPGILLASLERIKRLADTDQSNLMVKEVANWIASERELLTRLQDDFKNRLAVELPKLLDSDNFKIRGAFPKLSTKFYTLVVDFNNNSASVWYGPEDTLLAKVPLDSATIAQTLKEEHRKLTDRSASPKFIEALLRAHAILSSQNKTEKVPLNQLLPLVAVFNQETEFLNDPTRERYRSYGRANFSYDIYKASDKVVSGKKIDLSTATISESKRKSDYLWVPSNDQGEGHIWSTLSFRDSK